MASSGIILSLSASAAIAGPTAQNVAPVRTANLTAAAATDAEDSVAVSQAVTVAADVNWSLGSEVEVSAEAPPPPPPPEPEPEPEPVVTYERTEQTSRSTERAEPEPEPEPAPVAASGVGAQIVEIAYRYLGTPYVWGGSTPSGFDCSGFTSYVYAQVGISLPRSSGAQAGAGTRVSASEARPGDLVWWPGHIGIYLGGNQHIAARNPGTPLTAGPIYNSSPTFIRVAG
ncbi:C40 family peptidase [Ruania alba]|uniref:Cell wall-associated hydrolase, NlpC family n=1 Tax=Ruania alba TaxID=648782 RepID=A0A1H5MYY5_9MICO|nr:C40 family peptidase [Ruania alba]SEE93947.1 Cell wall-associated hydrolase, NlpC family [Ruania alba]